MNKDIQSLDSNLGLYPKLTKDYILKHLTQEQIFEKYTGITVSNKTLEGSSVLSPFRIDKNPTCNYWYNENGKLRFRDWSGDFHGDCFDACAKRIGINANSKYGFTLILHTIARDFSIHKYKDAKYRKDYDDIISVVKGYKKKTKSQTLIKIIPRQYNYHDESYWYKKYKLTLTIKDLPLVYPAEQIYIKQHNTEPYLYYTYSPRDPAYCYYGGKDERGVDKWKIYFPYRKERGGTRFISNHSFLQGESLLTCGRVLILTKSYKDVLCFRKYGLQAVAPSAESVILKLDEYYKLKSKFDFIVSCMDYDRTGLKSAIEHRKRYGITPIMFTKGLFNSYDYKAKDFSDYVESNYEQVPLLLKSLYEKYKPDFKELDNYINKNIGWINKELY